MKKPITGIHLMRMCIAQPKCTNVTDLPNKLRQYLIIVIITDSKLDCKLLADEINAACIHKYVNADIKRR